MREGMHWLLWGLMTAMSAFAYNLGVDVMNAYQPVFEEYLPKFGQANVGDILFNLFPEFEPGYMLFTALCKTIIPSWYFMKAIFAIITNLIIFNLIKRYSSHFFSVLLLYFVLVFPAQHFGFLRQTMAIWFMLLAFDRMHKKQWVRSIVWLLIATLCHTSALVLFVAPIYFLIGKDFKRFFIIFAVFAIVFILFREFIISNVLSLGFSDYVGEKYETYSNDELRQRTFSFFTILKYVINVGIPLYTIYLLNKRGKDVEYTPEVFLASTFLLINIFMPFLARANDYLDIFRYMLFVEFFFLIAEQIREIKISRAVVFSLIVGYTIAVGISRYNRYMPYSPVKSIYAYYPYSSVFTKNMPPERQYIYNVRVE
ncbi:MAG: EpsG family protein [Bacteroidales bacterium]|nr:EpsG family protein [Bacteroidales bacterium]